MTQGPVVVRRLSVEADLRLELAGRPARLTGSGRELTLYLADPVDALSQVGLALLPRAGRLTPRRLGLLADGLTAAGLRLTVRGPGGALLVLGQEGSRPVRWLTRSPSVALGSPLAVARMVARLVLQRLRRRSRPA